jgi:hypothetical protein
MFLVRKKIRMLMYMYKKKFQQNFLKFYFLFINIDEKVTSKI